MLAFPIACALASVLVATPFRMNQTERFYRIDQLLNSRGVVSFSDLMTELEVSRATLKRDIAHLRDRLNAPIVFDTERRGYRFEQSKVGPTYQLPGLWFSAEEALALMTMHQMLESLDAGGLLGPHVKPLMERLGKALGADAASATDVLKRVKLLPSQQRRMKFKWFEVVGKALMTRARLSIVYFTRYKNERSEREVSPQRLVHYRGNWYLDAWCHKSEGVRMFALDAIEAARLLDTKAKDVSLKQVDEQTAQGYGIYRGKDLQWATLVFTPEAARWVRHEIWHEQQKTRELPDGRFELSVPYADSREIEMDVLRHGENVEIVQPRSLRDRIGQRLAAAVRQYGGRA